MQSQQKYRASETTDFLKNKDPLSKDKTYVFYKFIITDSKYVQDYTGDTMHF